MAWSVDRLGRSLQHLVAFLSEIRALKIDLHPCICINRGWTRPHPQGRRYFR